MKCARVKDDLHLFVAGDLSKWKTLAVTKHLRTCEACQAERVKIQVSRKVFFDAIQHHQVPKLNSDLWPAIKSKIAAHSIITKPVAVRKIDLKLLYRRLGFVIASLAFIAFVIFFSKRMEVAQLPGKGDQNLRESESITMSFFPVVEDVQMQDVTVMTFQTDDPKIKIVWFFKEEANL